MISSISCFHALSAPPSSMGGGVSSLTWRVFARAPLIGASSPEQSNRTTSCEARTEGVSPLATGTRFAAAASRGGGGGDDDGGTAPATAAGARAASGPWESRSRLHQCAVRRAHPLPREFSLAPNQSRCAHVTLRSHTLLYVSETRQDAPQNTTRCSDCRDPAIPRRTTRTVFSGTAPTSCAARRAARRGEEPRWRRSAGLLQRVGEAWVVGQQRRRRREARAHSIA